MDESAWVVVLHMPESVLGVLGPFSTPGAAERCAARNLRCVAHRGAGYRVEVAAIEDGTIGDPSPATAAAEAVRAGRVVTESVTAQYDPAVSRAYVYRSADLGRARPDLLDAVAAGRMSLRVAEVEACNAGVLAIVEANIGHNRAEWSYIVVRGAAQLGRFTNAAAAQEHAHEVNGAEDVAAALLGPSFVPAELGGTGPAGV